MKVHPAATIFPLMDEAALAALAQDVKANGLLEPVVLHPDGSVLDGRNRLAACELAGVEPHFRTWDGKGSAGAFVLSANLQRRHLSTSQRAMVSADAMPLFEAEAAERRRAQAPGPGRGHVGEKVRADLPGREPPPEHRARDDAATLAGVSPRSVENACKVLRDGAPELADAVRRGDVAVAAAADLAGLPHDEQRQIVAAGPKAVQRAAATVARQAKERQRQDKIATVADSIRKAPPPMPTQRYSVIVVDPPWRYDTRNEDASHRGRVPYPPMSLDEIKALDVAGLASPDCVLWLWATNGFLHEAFHVVEAWGFAFKAVLTWHKVNLGLGNYLRNVTEHCLVGVRGAPVLLTSNQSTLITEPRGEHSTKPEGFYSLVEGLCPGSKVELFARKARDGWTQWGAEAPPAAPVPTPATKGRRAPKAAPAPASKPGGPPPVVEMATDPDGVARQVAPGSTPPSTPAQPAPEPAPVKATKGKAKAKATATEPAKTPTKAPTETSTKAPTKVPPAQPAPEALPKGAWTLRYQTSPRDVDTPLTTRVAKFDTPEERAAWLLNARKHPQFRGLVSVDPPDPPASPEPAAPTPVKGSRRKQP